MTVEEFVNHTRDGLKIYTDRKDLETFYNRQKYTIIFKRPDETAIEIEFDSIDDAAKTITIK